MSPGGRFRLLENTLYLVVAKITYTHGDISMIYLKKRGIVGLFKFVDAGLFKYVRHFCYYQVFKGLFL